MNSEPQHGLVPRADDMALISAAASARAYRYARNYAAQGMDPVLAARLGESLANRRLAWLFTLGNWFMAWWLKRRWNQFGATDPRYKRNYVIPTGLIAVVGYATAAFMLVGSILVAVSNMPPAGY